MGQSQVDFAPSGLSGILRLTCGLYYKTYDVVITLVGSVRCWSIGNYAANLRRYFCHSYSRNLRSKRVLKSGYRMKAYMRRDVLGHLEEVLADPVAAGVGAEPNISILALELPVG